MQEYAEIKITVMALLEDINGPNELGLSDTVDNLITKLEVWLETEKRQADYELDFAVE